MEVTYRKKLEECGIDVEHGIKSHMGNEAMFIKFLKLVVMDDKFDALYRSAVKKDAKEIFEISHSLKGTVGTVGLSGIDALITGICETTRRGSLEGVIEKVDKVKEMHEEIKQYIALM